MKVISKQRNSKSCVICGMENEFGLKAPFYILEDNSVASVFKFSDRHQSYPGRTHGGLITAMLDEVIGRTIWAVEPNTYAVTTTINVTFRKPVPYNETVKARGIITHNSKIGFSAKGYIYDMNGTLLAEGDARYLKVKPELAFGDDVHADVEMCYFIEDDVTEIDF